MKLGLSARHQYRLGTDEANPIAQSGRLPGLEPDLFISVIVFHELEFGINCIPHDDRRARLQVYALSLRRQFAGRIIGIDLEVSETAGRLRAFENSTGRILAELDALIAATAMVKGCVLATRNVKDFETLGIPLLNPWDDAV